VPEDALEGLRRLGRRASAGESTGGRRHRPSKRVRRHWPHRLLIAANVVTALSLLGAGGAYGYVQWRLGEIRRITVGGLHQQGHSAQSRSDGSSISPFTLLAIGSDTRNLGSASSAQFGSSSAVAGSRSDSIILIRVVPRTRSLALLSIPRDTLVPIPGLGTTRINAAFNSGTPTLLVTVLEQDFGIEVNHVVEFNFATFQQVADAVGGVEQWFPAPARDSYSLLSQPAGCVNLSGFQALAFVRSRHYEYFLNGSWHSQLFPESDLARIQRQQAFTRDLLRKARRVAPTNLFELNSIIGGITKNLAVDKSFSNSLILSLAQDYRSANLSTIPSYTYPTVNSTAQPGALDPLTSDGRGVIQQWLDTGQTPAAAPAHPSSTATTTASPPATSVAPSSVSIAVLNGSGVGGQAATAGQDLTSLGYHVTVSGDAPNFGMTTTEIEYAPDSLAAAQQLQSQMVGGATLVQDPALTPSPYNLEVVTGQTYKGVKGGAGSSSGSSGTAAAPTTTTTIAGPAYAGTQTVDPDSSSIYHGVYVPPGLVPGQVPQTCGE
jgi:LCP family protein required for cell wall assembly